MNHVEQHINTSGHMRWAFNRAHYFWFVGGQTDDPKTIDRMRYRLTRDVVTLTGSTRKRLLTPVALITPTQASAPLIQALSVVPGWQTVVFGAQGLNVVDADKICINTADVILCYGDPSDELSSRMEALEHPPELIRRNMHPARTERQTVRPHITEPYARYWNDVDRLRKWRPNPEPGLIMRQVDVRPQFTV